MKKIAVVTGFDNSVISRETILLLIKKNYYVFATYEGNKIDREAFISENNISDSISFTQIDYVSHESIKNLIDQLCDKRIHAIVNCYATLAETDEHELRHEFFDFNYEEFGRVLTSNISVIASICMGLKDNMVSGGCIVNITSSAAEEGGFATISYNASKAALKNLSKSLANNFGPYNGVRVNCVAPGWIPQSKDVVAGNVVELANKLTPLSSYGDPKDVAQAVISLIENPYANNVNYGVDGGITSSYLMYLLESSDLSGNETNEFMRTLIKIIGDAKESVKSKND